MYKHEKRSDIPLRKLGVLIEYPLLFSPRNQKGKNIAILLRQVDAHVPVEANHDQALSQMV